MKAAAFPVNFWLPASYHTPRIVTSALFGGLLTKVGIYGLLRVLVMIMPAERLVLSRLIGWVAIATMILGVVCALAQTDIRRMLGFVLISGIGVMLAGLALGDAAGVSGTILYAVHSMLVMAALYLLSGMIRDVGGSFSLDDLAGLYDRAPLLAGIGAAARFRHRRPAARLGPVAEDRAWSKPRSMPARAGSPRRSWSAACSPRWRSAASSCWPSGAPKPARVRPRSPRAVRPHRLRGAADPACAVAGDGALPRTVHRCGEERGGRADRAVALCRRRIPGSGAMKNRHRHHPADAGLAGADRLVHHPERAARPGAQRVGVVLRARAEAAQRDRHPPAARHRRWPRCSSRNSCCPASASPGWC